MSTAKDIVIATLELLELILARLPLRDLLVTAPPVSKMWQALTLTPTSQCTLFFHPDPSVSPPTQNPLLVEIFPPFFPLQGQNHGSPLQRVITLWRCHGLRRPMHSNGRTSAGGAYWSLHKCLAARPARLSAARC
ncbi:hypothetical protein FB451DRAFT_157472 [Mycena latifolia]|nr:hypothetical protein FB451DRAFT_157472 [Mycena latifolia]